MDMFINDKYICSSVAQYGTRGEGGHSHGGMAGMGDDSKDAAIKTISSMSACEEPIQVKKGDKLSMNAQYDLQKHPLRQTVSKKGKTDVMAMWGISFSALK
jgi:hypothetical protein